MTAFAKLHPVTKVAFFVAAFVLTLAAGNPVFSAISLCTALLCMTQSGGRAFFNSTVFSLIIVAVAGLFNMLFAHYGNTVLFTVGDTDFLLEPLFYGLNQGVVMVGVMLWFRVLSYVQDSAETAYLFRFAPRTALLFSMVLGFLPRFNSKLRDIRDAQKGLCSSADKSFSYKCKTALSNLSALVTYSLESSIITADSMTARGYNSRAVSPSRYKMTARDFALTAYFSLSFCYIVFAKISHRLVFVFEPDIYFKSNDIAATVLFGSLMLVPFAVEITEVILWKRASLKA